MIITLFCSLVHLNTEYLPKKKNVDQVIRQESLKFSSKPACWDQEGNLSIVLSKMGWPYAGLIDCFSYNGPYTS